MFIIFLVLPFFWLVRTIKNILFWLYLWQLKEYHFGRFFAHFIETEKGKRLIINKLLFLKIFLLVYFLLFRYVLFDASEHFHFYIFSFFSSAILIIYFFEAFKAGKDFVEKKLKKPVFTQKIIFLFSFSILLYSFFTLFLLNRFNDPDYLVLQSLFFWLVFIDVSTPDIIAFLILVFQPITTFWQKKIIKKATAKRAEFKDLLVIGITGSYGKTSCKEFLAQILEKKFKVLETKKHQNSEVGISQCILNELKPEHQVFICEMGAYNKGGIKLLADIVKPKIGILTGINKQHLATFGSQENIVKTKFELIESLPKEGTAILNKDNKYIKSEIENQAFQVDDRKFYSIKDRADIWAEQVRVQKEIVSFKVLTKEGNSADFQLNLLGSQNIYNILAATYCAKKLGMNLKEIADICQEINPMEGAGKLIRSKHGLNIIDAAYSANPDSVISHLDYLKVWQGKKIIVMPCLIELGTASVEVHQRIGRKIGQVCDLAIITTKECYENIRTSALRSENLDSSLYSELKKPALEGGMKKQDILFLENPDDIFKKIKSFQGSEDVILLEGRVSKELIKLLLE